MKELQEPGSPTLCPAIMLLRDRKLLIGLRHYTPDKWKDISVWTVPGGRSDHGETIEATLRREIREETGIINVSITHCFGRMPGAKEGDTLILFAGETSEEPRLMEPEKFSEWKWADVDEMPENFIHPPALELVKTFIATHEKSA
jgi:8-oxo-dGTP diphosphatase